jgi:hypothetical protein
MAHETPYVYSKFKLRAVIGGFEFPDIVSISATFGLNSIPEATLIVASGKDTRTGQPATIHRVKGELEARAEAVVYLEVITTGGQTDKMPSGEFTIFRGYYSGLGYTRSFNEAHFQIHLIHWLDDLNNSSMLNGNWFPGAPYDLAQSAVVEALNLTEGDAGGQGGGGGGDADYIMPVPTIDAAGDVVTAANIGEDLWGKVLKRVFEKVANWPAPHWQNPDEKGNEAALKALERMPGTAPAPVPLALDVKGMDSMNIENSIRQGLTKDACESFAYTTFWSKLVGDYAPQFLFAVSPAVDWALPIPLYGGLREPYKKIFEDEYGYANFQASMQQIIESVDVYYSAVSDCGNNNGEVAGTVPSLAEPLGYFPTTPGQNKKGMKLVKEPPTWMTNIVPWSAYPGRTTGVTAKQPGDCCAPQTGESEPPGEWKPPGEAVKEQQDSQALNRFAEHWYKTEVLSMRYGELSGKLRFDIAPGSIVEIETPTRDKDVEPTLADSLFAIVMKVSFHINGEKATAGTSFMLSQLRSLRENQDDQFSGCETCGGEDRPPMYTQPWRGGELAKKN